MNRFASGLSKLKAQLLCAGLLLFPFAMSSLATGTWFNVRMDLPIVPISNQWTCPFPQPNGADDWADFSPFSSVLSPIIGTATYDFIWDNGRPRSSGLRLEVPTMARVSGNDGFYDTGGMGNRAVIQAIYATLLNTRAPASKIDVGIRGSLLVNDVVPAMYSDTIMASVIKQIRSATGISDGGNGTVEQLAAGLQAGSGYYLSCAPGHQFGAGSAQIFTSSSFMGSIDVSGFTDLLLNGTVMIVQTNKLVWNASKRAWRYGDDGLYLVKSITKHSDFSLFGIIHSYTYTLYDVATGATKVVTPVNQAIRNIWSNGGVSGSHTVTILDDGDDYAEVILGFAGLDPLVNHY